MKIYGALAGYDILLIPDYNGFWGGEHAGSPLQDSQKGGEHVGSPLHFVGANLRVRPFKSAAPKIRYNQVNSN